jgi:hypothetical protein
MRAVGVDVVCGGDCGNNNRGYVKVATAAEAISRPGCGYGVGRRQRSEQ